MSEKQHLSTDENKKLVEGFIEEVLNNRELRTASQYMAEDVIEQVPLPGQGPGLAGLKDVLRGLFTVFPDMHWTVEEQMAEADKVMTRFTWTGTHHAEFLGIPAAGRSVSVWGIVIDRIENGRVKDARILMDMFGLAQQLAG